MGRLSGTRNTHPTVNLILAYGGFCTRGYFEKRLPCSLGAALVVYAPLFPLVQADLSYFPSPSSGTNLSCFVVMKHGMQTTEIFCLALLNAERELPSVWLGVKHAGSGTSLVVQW